MTGCPIWPGHSREYVPVIDVKKAGEALIQQAEEWNSPNLVAKIKLVVGIDDDLRKQFVQITEELNKNPTRLRRTFLIEQLNQIRHRMRDEQTALAAIQAEMERENEETRALLENELKRIDSEDEGSSEEKDASG